MMVRGTIYLTISQVVFVITSFLLHPYLGRKLGPELYGIFGIISAFILINEYILMKGFYDTISKFVSAKETTADAIVKGMLRILVIAGLALGGIYFLFAEQIASLMNDPELAPYIRLFSFLIPVTTVATVYFGALNGLRQFGKQAYISMVFYVLRVIAVLVLVYFGFSVKGAIIGLLIADVCRLVLVRALYRPAEGGGIFEGRKIFAFASQLMVIAVFSAFIMNIDLLAVKVLLEDNLQTGLYTSAATLAKIPPFLIIPVAMTALPTISKSISDGDMVLTGAYVERSLKLLLIVVLPISLIIMATSENCISFLYGSQYIDAAGPLKILLLGGIFLSIKVVFYNVIVASGWPRYVLFIGLLSLSIDIMLLITLTDKIGLMGAATASAITHFFGFLISYVYVARKFMTRAIPLFLIRIVLASLVVYVIALVYSPKGFALLGFYAVLMFVFFALLFVVREFDLKTVRIKSREAWDEVKVNFRARS